MNVHEYQAKEILHEFGIPVPRGRVASTPEEAETIARELGGTCVVKAQIHAGGRGKGGGIKRAASPAEARQRAGEILGKNLVTHQTGPQGRRVRRVLIEEGSQIEQEFYLGLVLDRAAGRLSLIASGEGGVEIEEVAARSPEKIFKELIDPVAGLAPFQIRRLGYRLGLAGKQTSALAPILQGLVRAFAACDCSLAEINPLVLNRGGEFVALDAKMNFDTNAFFRQPKIAALRDPEEEDARELEAAKFDLSYIALDGNIGCMVNGAGLAMATMDIIKFYGGEPANFLDVGGGASEAKVTQAFKILLSDARVRGVLINIFGGIMRCDVLAQGVVAAAREIGIKVPLVVRLQGTNVEAGRKILADSGLRIIPAETMAEAAEKVVTAVKEG